VSTLRAGQHPPDPPAGRDEFWIDHTIDADRFDRISWKDLDATLRTRPDRFRNRLVIAGGNFTGSGDDARVPRLGAVAGVLVHALAAETILSNFPVKAISNAPVIAGTAAACGLLCAALLLGKNPYRMGVTASVAGAAYLVGTFLLFHFAKVLLPVIGPLLVCAVGAAAAWWIRLRRPAFPRD
jgi:CHASE2 domain-containing sensor protein